MSTIRPFKAIRAKRDKVNLVASRSYLSYTEKTLKEKLENNPFTFLHIINTDYNRDTKSFFTNKNKSIRSKFLEFKKNKILFKEKNNSFYIYQQEIQNHKFIGIIGASSIYDYLNNTIKKHENTLIHREKMFCNYLEDVGFNAEPVLLCYQKNIEIEKILNKYVKTRSEYEFTTSNKSSHKLWIVNNNNDINVIINIFKKIDNLYIADGHHRIASSALLHKKTGKNNYFMSYLIDEDQLNILNFNRLVKTTNINKIIFLKKLKEVFHVKKILKVRNPIKENEIIMCFPKTCYSLILKNKNLDCVEKLDTFILSKHILNPLLRIKDERKDKNIFFEPGTTSLDEIELKINSNKFDIAFILKPITVKQLKDVADKNMSMPPKSTYIQPKLRSGLIIYPIFD